MPVPPLSRLFFALWPDDGVRGALARTASALKRECGGRAVPAGNIHLTLVFLGNVETARVPEVCACASGVVTPVFGMTIDVLEYWRRNRIVCAAPRDCPDSLRALVVRLERALMAGGLRFDARPYVPHITLLREALRAPVVATLPEVAWQARDFVLVQSARRDGGSVYEVIGRWPLRVR